MFKQKYIAVEGPDGVGKSSFCKELEKELTKKGYTVYSLIYPGVSKDHPIGSKLRDFCKNYDLQPTSDLLCYWAAMQELSHIVELKLMDPNGVVICDRCALSTIIYQGYYRGLLGNVKAIYKYFPVRTPDYMILLHAPKEVCRERYTDRGENMDKWKADDSVTGRIWDFYNQCCLKNLDMMDKNVGNNNVLCLDTSACLPDELANIAVRTIEDSFRNIVEDMFQRMWDLRV